MVQLIRIQLELGFALQYDVILIHLRIHSVDLPLTEGVVQSVVNR